MLLAVACKAFFVQVDQTFYQNQRQCDLLAAKNEVYHYEFN